MPCTRLGSSTTRPPSTLSRVSSTSWGTSPASYRSFAVPRRWSSPSYPWLSSQNLPPSSWSTPKQRSWSRYWPPRGCPRLTKTNGISSGLVSAYRTSLRYTKQCRTIRKSTTSNFQLSSPGRIGTPITWEKWRKSSVSISSISRQRLTASLKKWQSSRKGSKRSRTMRATTMEPILATRAREGSKKRKMTTPLRVMLESRTTAGSWSHHRAPRGRVSTL